MAKQKIVVKDFIADFRSGMDDSDLREKYALTRRQLDKTLEKLVRLGKLEITDFDDEGMTFEPTMELAGTCPNCGALMLADTPHCPICEVTVHEGESAKRPKARPKGVEPPPAPEPPDPKTVIQRISREVSAFKPSEALTQEAASREEAVPGDSPVDESAEAPSAGKRRVSPVIAAAGLALVLVVAAAGAAIFTDVIPLETLWPEPPVVKRERPPRTAPPPETAPDRPAGTEQSAAPPDHLRVAKKAPTPPIAPVEPVRAPALPPTPATSEPRETELPKPTEFPVSEAPPAVETPAPGASEEPVEEAPADVETEPQVTVREPGGAPNTGPAVTESESPLPSEAPPEPEAPVETPKIEPEPPVVESVDPPAVGESPLGATEDRPPAPETPEIPATEPPTAEIPSFPSRTAESAEPEALEQEAGPTDSRRTSMSEAHPPTSRPIDRVERPERAASLDRKAGARALIEAAHHGDVDRIESLIARGADVNAVDESGNTALMVAAGSGRIKAVQALMRHGADVSVKNKRGISALGWAYNPLPGDYVPLRIRRQIVQLLKGRP